MQSQAEKRKIFKEVKDQKCLQILLPISHKAEHHEWAYRTPGNNYFTYFCLYFLSKTDINYCIFDHILLAFIKLILNSFWVSQSCRKNFYKKYFLGKKPLIKLFQLLAKFLEHFRSFSAQNRCAFYPLHRTACGELNEIKFEGWIGRPWIASEW